MTVVLPKSNVLDFNIMVDIINVQQAIDSGELSTETTCTLRPIALALVVRSGPLTPGIMSNLQLR
jgi:hypothetical protein